MRLLATDIGQNQDLPKYGASLYAGKADLSDEYWNPKIKLGGQLTFFRGLHLSNNHSKKWL